MDTFDATTFFARLFAGPQRAELEPAAGTAHATVPVSDCVAKRKGPCGWRDGETRTAANDPELDGHDDDPLIMNGWTRRSWRERLHRLADGCRELNTARAAELMAWAQALDVQSDSKRN